MEARPFVWGAAALCGDAFASDEKSVRRPTASFVRRCPKKEPGGSLSSGRSLRPVFLYPALHESGSIAVPIGDSYRDIDGQASKRIAREAARLSTDRKKAAAKALFAAAGGEYMRYLISILRGVFSSGVFLGMVSFRTPSVNSAEI